MSKTNYASLLNTLCEMQESPMYAARKGVLADAENTIRQLEKERDKYKAELRKAREQEPVAWMHDNEGRVDVCHDSVKKLWIKVRQKQNTQFMREIVPCKVEHYNIPLYAYPKPAAPAVPEELIKLLLAEFPLFEDEGLCEEEHHCEWSMQQDRKRLHRIPQTTGAKP